MAKQTLFTVPVVRCEEHNCASETVNVVADQRRGKGSSASLPSTLVAAVAGVTRAGQGGGRVKVSSF